MRWIFAVMVVALSACTTQSGVIADGPDAYRVMITGQTGFTPAGKLKIDAYRQATAHCARSGKRMETIEDNSVNNGFLRFPAADVRFRCVS
jgi:hypothetical protein